MTPAQVIADTQRWLERAVIGLNLCPFAKAVHLKGQIRYRVTETDRPDALLSVLREELEWLAGTDPQRIETTLLIHPQVLTDFIDYAAFLGQANRALRKGGYEGVLQLASFHPRYAFADSAPEDIENCSNRSPYPMLHLLREASVEQAVAAVPDAAQIYGRNMDTLRRLGHAGWNQLWADTADS